MPPFRDFTAGLLPDGIVSTASLVVGVAVTEAARQDVPVAGINRGMLAMLATAAVGRLFGTRVA